MLTVRILMWMLFALSWNFQSCWSEDLTCIQVKQPRSQCDVLNISSRAVQPLMKFDVLMLQIDRVSMLHPDGEVTRMLNRIALKATYNVFNDKILRIPADSQLKILSVKSAPQLQTIKVLGANNALKSLSVDKSAIRRIPTSVQDLKRLKYLFIRNSAVDTLSVKPLQGIRRLTEVYLEYNNLRRLEVSKGLEMVLPIERLMLSFNLLEFIDMEFFTPFKRLRELDLNDNRLKQIIANKPVTFPLLHSLRLGRNQLMQLNLSNWIAPKLELFEQQSNNMTQLPFGIGRFTALKTLYLNFNQITVLYLQHLADLSKLTSLEMSRNRLHTILPDCKSPQKPPCQRISLPALREIQLDHNNLTDIDLGPWDMPALVHIALQYNRLQRLRNLDEKFPNLRVMNIWNNTIRCFDLHSMKTYLAKEIVKISVMAESSSCSTNSSFPTKKGVTCCNE